VGRRLHGKMFKKSIQISIIIGGGKKRAISLEIIAINSTLTIENIKHQ
jgi:hypothetical protein